MPVITYTGMSSSNDGLVTAFCTNYVTNSSILISLDGGESIDTNYSTNLYFPSPSVSGFGNLIIAQSKPIATQLSP
jgi:hypothetical protein